MSTAAIFLGLSASVAGHTLLVHYSRQQPGPKYSTSKMVLFTEALKLIAGLTMITRVQGSTSSGADSKQTARSTAPASTSISLSSVTRRLKLIAVILYQDVKANPRDAFKTCVPSFMYALQNNLVLVSLTNLDAATFLVTSQLKIFFTAFFMWLLMGKTFSRQRCFSLGLLCAGEVLVHWETLAGAAANLLLPTEECLYGDKLDGFIPDEITGCNTIDVRFQASANLYNSSMSVTSNENSSSYVLGLSTALLTCIGSGFAGVYLEIVLKHSASSFWIRNVQLYIWGIVSNGLIVVVNRSGTQLHSLDGFNKLTLLIIVTSALVGFCTAIIIQRLDNIWKNLASSAAVVMATFVSAVFFGTSVGLTSAAGTLLVIAVPWLYHTGYLRETYMTGTQKEAHYLVEV